MSDFGLKLSEARDMYNRGVTVKVIAELAGVEIVEICEALGVSPDEEDDKLDSGLFLELYNRGFNDAQIGLQMGIDRQLIGKYRRSIGLPTQKSRKRMESEKL